MLPWAYSHLEFPAAGALKPQDARWKRQMRREWIKMFPNLLCHLNFNSLKALKDEWKKATSHYFFTRNDQKAQAAEFYCDCIHQNCWSQRSWLRQNSINIVVAFGSHCFLFVPHFIGFLRNVLWLAVVRVSLMHTENTGGLRNRLQTQHSFYHWSFWPADKYSLSF